MKDKLKAFWRRFLAFFHLITKGDHDEVCEIARATFNATEHELRTTISEQTAELAEREKTIDDALAKVSDLEDMISKLTRNNVQLSDTVAQYAKKEEQYKTVIDSQAETIAAYENGPKQKEEYVKAVEKQLAEHFKDHPAFGFPNNLPLPGSICFNIIPTENTPNSDGVAPDEVIQGKMILADAVAEKIEAAPDITSRYEILVNYLRKYGTLNTIMTKLIRMGCMEMVITYNEESQTKEVYYEMTARSVKGKPCFQLDPPWLEKCHTIK